MRENLWLRSASRVGHVWALVEPREMCGQIARRRSHLVYYSGHKLPQSHEGVWGERGGEVVVRGCGGIGGLILEEHFSGVGMKGLVRSSHELGGGMVVPGGGGVCRTSGRRLRPSCGGRVRCVRASTGRRFLIGGEVTFVRHLRGR